MRSLEVYCKTDVGRRRKVNEDSLLAVDLGDVHLLAVADGLGGHAAGEIASKIAIIEIEQYLRASLANSNAKDAIKEAVIKANREIRLLSQENPTYTGMGTTLVVALVSNERAIIANVGDSRAYLVGGEIRQITKDHSLVQELVDGGVIAKEEAFDHPQKNIVTMTLGSDDLVYPDFYETKLSGGILLLCSDGLSDSLRDDEIERTVTTSTNIEKACTKLIELANEKGGADNISVILTR